MSIRGYISFPSITEIVKRPGVIIVDNAGPAPILGVGTGFACVIGEFVKGYQYRNIPTEVSGGQDRLDKFGGWKTTMGDQAVVGGLNPTQPTWDGNGHVALLNKSFARLAVLNIDQGIGFVTFTRTLNTYGTVVSTIPVPFGLTPAGQIVIDIDAPGAPITVTFNATAAARESTNAELYNLTAPANVLTVKVNRGSVQTLTLAAGYFVDPANATAEEVAAAINDLLIGGSATATTGGTKVTIKSDKKGTGSYIEITGGSANAILNFNVAEVQGTGNVADITAVSMAEAILVINTALGVNGTAWSDDNVYLKIRTNTAGAGGQIQVTGAGAPDMSTAMGLDLLVHAGTATGTGSAGTVPAGTVVSDGGANRFATLEDVTFTSTATTGTGAETGSTSIPIRPANNATYTGATVLAHAINTVVDTIDLDGDGVTDVLVVDNALATTAWTSVVSARYSTAIATLLSKNAPAKDINIIFCARHTIPINALLKAHVAAAFSQGLFRVCPISPVLATAKTTATGSTPATFGVGVNRHERIIYNYPGWQTYSEDLGYNIDVTSDSFAASIMSQIAPERSPAEYVPDILTGVVDLEKNCRQGGTIGELTNTDYENFITAGIMAPIMEGGAQYDLGINSHGPTDAARKYIDRTRMADYISQSIAARAAFYVKKVASDITWGAFVGEATEFMFGLKSEENPPLQRIRDCSVDSESGNTAATAAARIKVLVIKAKTLGTMDDIVLNCYVGDQVVVVAE